MIGSRYLVALFWISCTTTSLENGNFDSKTVRDENADNVQRSLVATVRGNLFGSLLKKKICRKTSEGVFETIRVPRFRSSGNPGDRSGSCGEKCASLCPAACFGSLKADGSKCVCGAYKCSGNAACVSDKCECKIGFNGNGLNCCDTSSGLTLSGSVCVAPKSPTAPSAPVTPSVNTPLSPAPRTPRLPGRDIVKPKLVDFVAFSSLTVNVSSAADKIDFQITAQDDESGVKTILIVVNSFYRRILYNKTYTTPTLGKVVHNFSLPFSKYVQAGSLFILMGVYDFAGNALELTDPAVLAERGFPYDIEVFNTKNDTLPPKLLGVRPLTPLVVNITLLNFTDVVPIIFEVKVEDDFSGVGNMFAEWQVPPFGSFLQSYGGSRGDNYYYDSVDFPLAGQPLSFNMTVAVQKSTPLGVYSMRSLHVYDLSGKDTLNNAATLSSMMWSYSITIVK